MKLVASMMVGDGEKSRYLGLALDALAWFCDGICVVDESTDGTVDVIAAASRIVSHERTASPREFFAHEGRARQLLLDVTLEQKPTHILSIDADEFVSDGQALRAACEADDGNGAWTLSMEEVWKADERHLWTRQDGGWRSHQVPVLYRVPERRDGQWRIQDRQLACGREPLAIRQLAARAPATGASLLHFGWANQAERQARYDRYAEADGGKFHASSHLQSILWPDKRVRFARRSWPEGLAPYKDALLARTQLVAA